MDTGTAFKILALVLWPFVLIFLYYLIDRKGFRRQLEKYRKDGWF